MAQRRSNQTHPILLAFLVLLGVPSLAFGQIEQSAARAAAIQADNEIQEIRATFKVYEPEADHPVQISVYRPAQATFQLNGVPISANLKPTTTDQLDVLDGKDGLRVTQVYNYDYTVTQPRKIEFIERLNESHARRIRFRNALPSSTLTADNKQLIIRFNTAHESNVFFELVQNNTISTILVESAVLDDHNTPSGMIYRLHANQLSIVIEETGELVSLGKVVNAYAEAIKRS